MENMRKQRVERLYTYEQWKAIYDRKKHRERVELLKWLFAGLFMYFISICVFLLWLQFGYI